MEEKKENNPPIEIILRALQKDNQYNDTLSHKLFSIIESLSNFLRLNFSAEKIEAICKILFYYLCYVLNKNKLTPGEELTSTQILFSNKKNILWYIITLSCEKIILKYVLQFIQKKINLYTHFIQEKNLTSNTNFFRRLLLKLDINNLLNSDNFIDKYEEIQYCLFFLNGKYCNFIQKIFGAKYVYQNENENPNLLISRDGFKFLGYTMGVKLFLEFFNFTKNIHKNYQKFLEENKFKEQEENKIPSQSLKLKTTNLNFNKLANSYVDNTCLLCMEKRKDVSVTICGHLFCWDCIIKYLQTNSNCPFCRTKCLPQQVVYLQNYIE